MINMIFFLNYQQQLRQTMPRFSSSVESAIVKLIESCGGNIQQEHKYLHVSFDDRSVAFWLDLLILIEKLDQILKDSSDDLYGHACLITPFELDPGIYSGMLRELTVYGNYTGIWLDKDISAYLDPYFEFNHDADASISFITKNHFDVIQVKHIKKIHHAGEDESGGYPLRKTIIDVLKQQKKNLGTILVGQDFIGLKDGLYHFCKEQLGDVSPLVFRFGAGGRGLSCIVDALEPEIKQFLAADVSSAAVIKQLEILKEPIACERLRDEYPLIMKEKAEQFLSLLADTYIKTIKKQNLDPLIIIENIDEMDETAFSLMIQKVKDLQNISGISVFCTAKHEDNLDVWKNNSFKTLYFSLPGGKVAESCTGKNLSRDMKELWEIAYMCYLMRPYFPGYTFLSIFSEEGKNPAVTSRAFEILHALGIIASSQDLEPVMVDFAKKAETVIGDERVRMIKSIVRNRLLAWVNQEKLLPCFNLLSILAQYDGKLSDDLILDALCRDVIDGVYSGLKKNIESGKFDSIAGNARILSLRYVFHTLTALVHGDEETIRRVFLSLPPTDIPSPRYESYIESNLASYQLSIRSIDEALVSVKKAMLAAQSTQSRGGARAFRLYALVNVIRGNISDAIEYLQFAADHAERNKDWEELVIINYYSSVIHFLFGNISKAERLADHAESDALTCGMTPWRDKSRFLKGRILFEQGKYFDAYDVFESILPTDESANTLNAWKYRTKVYSGGLLPEPVKNTGDGAIFLIEAAYINREYDKAVELADQLLMTLSDHNFILIEQADWQSGFSQTELLMFPQKVLLYRLISTYRSLALSHQKSIDPAADTPVSIMNQITRGEKYSNTDTNDAFYFFAQYQVLQNANASEVDLNTAVSMAFKRLQRRASRIDDIETKRAFLFLNRWNAALGEAAKHHKLI
ncbi:MAG: hypothetical protein LBV20_07970 [Treponema sp.]|jgi:tetratricopeptide (TPR) repeat protein|nr:hypothetical protein [Treponema sp.]